MFALFSRLGTLALLSAALTAGPACDRPPAPPTRQVVLYTSVDQQFAEQIVRDFETQTGLRVLAAYDTEAGKTTGFLRRLRREAPNPRCDVWWSSEVFGTIELARDGLLEPYESPAARDVPPEWRDPGHAWVGLAARARVAAFRRVGASTAPTIETWRRFLDGRWEGRLAIANPQFGTTRGHLAAMFAYWGESTGRDLLQKLRDRGVIVADGNAHAVRLVAAGEADLCWTDTDDVWVAQRRGQPVDLVYPALGEDLPAVWIPCTVGLVRGGPNPENARRLVDFLVAATVEEALYRSDSRNIPVRPALRAQLGCPGPHPQPLDFARVADALPAAMTAARDILLH